MNNKKNRIILKKQEHANETLFSAGVGQLGEQLPNWKKTQKSLIYN